MSGTESTNVSITLTVAEWQVCFAGLAELPLKISGQVAMKLQRQVSEAVAANVSAAEHAQHINGELRGPPIQGVAP